MMAPGPSPAQAVIGAPARQRGVRPPFNWVAVEELQVNYHNPQTILFTIDHYISTLWQLKLSSLTATQSISNAHIQLPIALRNGNTEELCANTKPWPWPVLAEEEVEALRLYPACSIQQGYRTPENVTVTIQMINYHVRLQIVAAVPA